MFSLFSSKEYFMDKEVACNCSYCNDGSNHMSKQFMRTLNKLRTQYGKPIVLSSAYRCGEYNNSISSTGYSGPHTTGKAVDIPVAGEDAHRLIQLAFELGFTGIGIRQHGSWSKRFIHIDMLTTESYPRPRIWTYND